MQDAPECVDSKERQAAACAAAERERQRAAAELQKSEGARRLAPADGERGPGDMPPEMRAAAAAAEAAVMAKFRASKEARDRAVRGGH